MARVVIITPYFWPDIAANVPIIGSLCEDLVKKGHEVSVWTNWPGRISKEERRRFKQNRIKPEIYCGAIINRCINPFVGKMGMVKRFFEYIFFFIWVFLKSLLLSSRFDVFLVQSTPPFTNLVIIGKSRPVIYNLQDIFPDSIVNSGLVKNKKVLAYLQRIEKKCYERATVVTVISESFQKHISKLTMKANPLVVPNWIDTEKISYKEPSSNRFMEENALQNKFIVMYAGNIGYNQNLEIILTAAERLNEHPDIEFVVVGNGQYKQEIIQLARKKKLDNIRFYPFQPEEMVAEVYSTADVALITMKSDTLLSSVPSKTWTIMATRRPIIACVDQDSELAHIIQYSQSGIISLPEESNALVENIEYLYNNKDLCLQMGINGRRYVEKNLSRDSITERYDQIINKLVAHI